jgi:hypothetical protein
MILINSLDYSFTEWHEVAALQGKNISKQDVSKHLEIARRMSCIAPISGDMGIIEHFFRPLPDRDSGECNVITIFNQSDRKVLAQVEALLQDGCCPPIHYVLAHAPNPTPSKASAL